MLSFLLFRSRPLNNNLLLPKFNTSSLTRKYSSSTPTFAKKFFVWGTNANSLISPSNPKLEKELSPKPFKEQEDLEFEVSSHFKKPYSLDKLIPGFDTTAALFKPTDGVGGFQVMSWGCNTNFKLGHSDVATPCIKPTLITLPEAVVKNGGVKDVFIGMTISAIVDMKGCLHAFGIPRSEENAVSSLTSMSNVYDTNNLGTGIMTTTNQIEPKLVESLVEDGVAVKSGCVGLGEWHSVILTDEGEVLCVGDGSYGKLGSIDKINNIFYEPIDFFSSTLSSDSEDGMAVKIAAGQDHTLLLTSTGQLYTWGKNDKLQLGVGEGHSMAGIQFAHEPEPLLIDFFEENEIKVRDVSAGRYSSSAVCTEGNLYVWGRNVWGFDQPELCTGLLSKDVVRCYSGDGYTLALDSDGILYSMGKSSTLSNNTSIGHGALGVGDVKGRNWPVEVVGVGRGGGKIVGVEAGGRHVVVEVDDEKE